MKPTTLEWITKAEDDWHVAQMSSRARKHPSYDAAAFHAQQCVEKYLKARLEEATIAFGRTHDLLVLHQLVLSIEQSWVVLQPLPDSPQSIRRCLSVSRHFGHESRRSRCAEQLP